jgi:branched-chain amino acid transport system substrate-binding protein
MRARAIVLAGAFALSAALPAAAQQTIRIGELNSYKAQPAFLDPYKKGWEMANEEINNAGGVLGKKLEIVSRDDGANPGDAVRVAEELTTGEGVNILCGTFLSNVGLAVTEFAGKKKVFFLAAEPLTDKITWQNGKPRHHGRFQICRRRERAAFRRRGEEAAPGGGGDSCG